MPRGKDGSIIGDAVAVSTSSASGIWTMSEVHKYVTEEIWPTNLATGGVKSIYGTKTVHTFTAGTNLIVNTALTADILVVAGGGSGGGRWGGGGGGGGVVWLTGTTLAVGTYVIEIGDGGDGISSVYTSTPGINGDDTTFTLGTTVVLLAKGGGRGNAYNSDDTTTGGSSGGTGAHFTHSAPGATTQGATTQTYVGGTLINYGSLGGDGPDGGGSGGGGGGANDAGTDGIYASTPQGTYSTGGDGVAVTDMSGDGTTYYWAGGGGGAGWYTSNFGGNGGKGGGGGGAGGGGATRGEADDGTGLNDGADGVTSGSGGNGGTNTGGGGGGKGEYTETGSSGAGGSGIVIVRYSTYP